jgi:hypothetical protein
LGCTVSHQAEKEKDAWSEAENENLCTDQQMEKDGVQLRKAFGIVDQTGSRQECCQYFNGRG